MIPELLFGGLLNHDLECFYGRVLGGVSVDFSLNIRRLFLVCLLGTARVTQCSVCNTHKTPVTPMSNISYMTEHPKQEEGKHFKVV